MAKYSFEQFCAVRNQTDISFSPDGQWVTYVSNASGQYNVWKQPVHLSSDGFTAMPVQLTALVEQSARRAVWCPKGERILTLADFQGNENFQLFEIPPNEGWLYPITNDPEVRHEFGDQPFSPDGKFIAFGSNKRDRSCFDVVIRELDSGTERILLSGDANYFPTSWSPDGKTVLAIQSDSNVNTNLYLCPVDAGDARLLTPHTGDVKYYPGPWNPDGTGFYLISDMEREFLGIGYYTLAAEKWDWRYTPDWDVQYGELSTDGKTFVVIVNERGYSALYIQDSNTNKFRKFNGLPKGVYGGIKFAPDSSLLGLYVNYPKRPAELFVLDVERDDFWQLSQNYLGGIRENDMVEPVLVHYPTHDVREIPAFLYEPAGLKKGVRFPVILSIHGGPEAQELPTYAYNGFYQYLLHLGFGILAPNIRGSTGYGKSYQKLIHRDWGGAELQDLDHAAKYLQSLDWVDSNRIGVFGGSFGGFATLSCVTRLPNYWAAAVDIVGPSNLITFTKSVPPFWRRYLKQWVGDPEEDAEMLAERSPITYVDHVKTPLLVIQGENDPRVAKAESDQMVDRLKELGQTVEYVVFDDEGHGFTKTANWLKALRISGDWFAEHMLD